MEKAKKLLAQGKPLDALDRLKKLLKTVDKDKIWRVHELLGAAYHDLADAELAAQAYYNAANTDTILRNQRAHWSNYLFALHYLPLANAEILYDAAKVYNSLYRDVERLKLKPRTSKKIHVAYIAPHFLDSSSARFYESLLTDYNRKKFFVTAWSLDNRADDFTEKIKQSVDGYFDISETSFEEAAEQIRDAGADILFDLGGHSEGGVTLQVAAYKPARVQISGIGYFDTTGLDAIDYFLTDKYLAKSQTKFTEKLLIIDSAFALTPNQKMIDAKKNLVRKPHNGIMLGCLNNFMKINILYLEMILLNFSLLKNVKAIFRDTTPLESRRRVLIGRLKRTVMHRSYPYETPIECIDVRLGEDNFFDDYSEIDIIFDTFPYTGGFMTALALYMGVPVSTQEEGWLHHHRIAPDMLRAVGLKELNGYDHFLDSKKIEGWREKINLDKLLDTKSFVRRVYRKFTEVLKDE